MAVNKLQISQNLLSRFYKQRDSASVKQAEELGYFFNPSKEALLSHCQEQNSQQNDIAVFSLIQLSGVHLRVLGDIGLCTRLSICLLANNFLTKMDALIACKHLIRLDLHSNQLMSIPGSSFWENMDKLQVLHLHDNPLGKSETSQILSSSPCLSILTLYDTPLSLNKNYRHHVVNSIWTLKALDKHVISDEEIIEDAVFSNGRFTALSPAFRTDLCPRALLDSTFDQEMSVLHALIAKVNSILAKHSPVHIVQRCVRGYLVRRKLGLVKKLNPIKSIDMMSHPPSTPVFFSSQPWATFAADVVDYDKYMRSIRPDSEVANKTLKELQQHHVQSDILQGQTLSNENQRFSINIQKLQTGILSRLQADTVVMEKVLAEMEGLGLVIPKKENGRKKHGKENTDNKPKPQRVKDIKQFFGPVDQICLSDNEENDVSLIDFRLKGKKPNLLLVDATVDMILSKKEAGQMIREAEAERMRKNFMKPPIAVKHNKFTSNEQRLFNKSHGVMSLSSLMAVHKAYQEREKAEAAAIRRENLLGLREEKLRAKDRINRYRDEHRVKLLKSRDLDRSIILEKKEKQELQQLNFLDKLQQQKIQSSDVSKALRADHSFMNQFNCQHTSVSNALLRYDHQTFAEDSKNRRQKYVSKVKKTLQEQTDVMKKFLEHQKLMRLTDAAVTKAALKTKISAEANDRLMEARHRVAELKARQASDPDFYSLPSNTISYTSSAPAGISMWEASSEVSFAGRADGHMTLYT